MKIGAGVHVPRCNTSPIQTTRTGTSNTTQATTNKTDRNICIVQINSISNKQKQLKQLADTTQPNIITVQKTKLTTSKTPNIPNYTPTHTDSVGNPNYTHTDSVGNPNYTPTHTDSVGNPNYTPTHTDSVRNLRGRLLIYIKHNITFTDLNISINTKYKTTNGQDPYQHTHHSF